MLTRPQGILVALLLLHAQAADRLHNWRGAILFAAKRLRFFLLPAAAAATLLLWQWRELGTPLGFLEAQRAYWGRSANPASAARALGALLSLSGLRVDLAATIFALALLPGICRRLPASFAAYAVTSVALPLASGTTLSMARFISVCFPHFLFLASLLKPRRRTAVAWVAVSAVLYLFAARALVAWHFIG